jgi:hypothetical protein
MSKTAIPEVLELRKANKPSAEVFLSPKGTDLLHCTKASKLPPNPSRYSTTPTQVFPTAKICIRVGKRSLQ